MFLHSDREGRNFSHIASFRSDVDVMQRLWELAKARLTTEEIKNKMLLRTDNEELDAW